MHSLQTLFVRDSGEHSCDCIHQNAFEVELLQSRVLYGALKEFTVHLGIQKYLTFKLQTVVSCTCVDELLEFH